jgi:hypothetical protein
MVFFVFQVMNFHLKCASLGISPNNALIFRELSSSGKKNWILH